MAASSTVDVTVTSETKEIANGITARVVRDTVRSGGEIVEDTFDWYAQDAAGAIWYLGEDTAEFEDGEIVSREGSFEAGVDGALPGIAVPADPSRGWRYRQEYSAGEAEDNGAVLSVEELVEVPYGRFERAPCSHATRTRSNRGRGAQALRAAASGPCSPSTSRAATAARSSSTSRRCPTDAGTGPLGSPD